MFELRWSNCFLSECLMIKLKQTSFGGPDDMRCFCRWRTCQTQLSFSSIRPMRTRSALAGLGGPWLLLRGGAAGKSSIIRLSKRLAFVVTQQPWHWQLLRFFLRSYKSVDGRTTPLLCGTNPPTPQPASPDPGHCPMLHDYSYVPSPMSPASPDTASNPHTPCSRDSHRLLSSEDTRCSTPDFTFEERVRSSTPEDQSACEASETFIRF